MRQQQMEVQNGSRSWKSDHHSLQRGAIGRRQCRVSFKILLARLEHHSDVQLEDFEVEIPKCIPAGEYLMRIEQIAIHVPGIPPQFHVACAQLGVFGIGKELPPASHLVKIPEVHSKGHEGFTVNIYQNFRDYKMPGPSVWSC